MEFVRSRSVLVILETLRRHQEYKNIYVFRENDIILYKQSMNCTKELLFLILTQNLLVPLCSAS